MIKLYRDFLCSGIQTAAVIAVAVSVRSSCDAEDPRIVEDGLHAAPAYQHAEPSAQWREPILMNPEASESPDEGTHQTADCNCGDAKHCHGVCRDPGHPKKPWCEKPGDVNRGDCPPLRYRIADFERAGKPNCVHRWAKCSSNSKYSAWFVGGGSAFNGKIATALGRHKLPYVDGLCGCEPGCCEAGRCRKQTEGTWGLDYDGLFKRKKVNVWLKYTHGRYQGGEGAYATDGEPKIVSKVREKTHALLGIED